MRSLVSQLLVLALVAIVTCFYPLLAPTPHRIDQEHFDLIRVGMTKAEVEAIFGVPAGKYDWAEPGSPLLTISLLMALQNAEFVHDEGQVQLGGMRFLSSLETSVGEAWVSRHGAFTVRFDSDDRVVSTTGRQDVGIVPPWQRWWRKVWER
jgi:hypothetical protein